MPSVFLLTLGCPKNEADSDSFAGCFSAGGWEIADNSEKADLLLLNTCAFIQPAVEESLEAIAEAVEWKNCKPGRKLILAGCLPGRYSNDSSGGLEDFDLITGPGDTAELRKYLSVSASSGPVPVESIYHRYLKISEGCSNNCAYCTIPLIRGRREDRSFEDILLDAGYLTEQGALGIPEAGKAAEAPSHSLSPIWPQRIRIYGSDSITFTRRISRMNFRLWSRSTPISCHILICPFSMFPILFWNGWAVLIRKNISEICLRASINRIQSFPLERL
ncbi:MAG: hypothetical protein K8R76_08320 [Candidatus Aegiribacteria sp.]|nr:hypothetical protein [Candidatus Aegiribacteria sp.]